VPPKRLLREGASPENRAPTLVNFPHGVLDAGNLEVHMNSLTDARTRIGARRARIHLPLAVLALGALCLTASGFAARAWADEPALPASFSPFAGVWQVDLPGANWDYAKDAEQKILPSSEVSVEMIDGKPKVVVTRYNLRVARDGTVRFVPNRQETSKVEVQGGTLTFRIHNDACNTLGEKPGPVDTEWKLEVKDHQRVMLSSVGPSAILPAPLEMRPATHPSNSREGC